MRNIYIYFPILFLCSGLHSTTVFLKLNILYNFTVLVGLPAPRVFYLLFYSYDYNMCLVTLLSSEQTK